MDQRCNDQKKDFRKIRKSLFWKLVFLWVLFGLLTVLLVYFLEDELIWMVVLLSFFSLLLLLASAKAILSCVFLSKSEKAYWSNDFESLLKWARFMRKVSFGKGKEVYFGDEARAYLLLNDFSKAEESFSHVHNLLYIDAFGSVRILLLLHEEKDDEAKAAYLSYALHHRNGRSYGERYAILMLDGLYHHLEGRKVEEEELMALRSAKVPYLQELMQKEPKKPQMPSQNEILLNASLSDRALLAKSLDKMDEINGQGEHRLSPWLLFLFVLSIVLPILFFLLSIVLGHKAEGQDPTKDIASMMWIMGFAALVPLCSLVLAFVAKKKEKKDHYVKNMVVGFIQFPLCVLLALFSIPSAGGRDYSYLNEVGALTSISFPKEGHLRTFERSGSVSPELVCQTLAVFDEGASYQEFVLSFDEENSVWVPWQEDYEEIAFSGAYHHGPECYAYDYVCLLNKTDSTKNMIPTAPGSYHFLEIAHVEDKNWVWIYDYVRSVK